MYVLKGFANHALLANNTPGTNNVIGEISNYSLTFSREIGQYDSASIAPNITLVSFLSNQDGTAVAVDPSLRDRTMTILQWIYNLVITESGQMFADVFLQAILTQFQGQAEQFACGNIVQDTAGHYCPEWVSWQDDGVTPGTPNLIKIWFADPSFQLQYDEYDIIVVPPITPIDDFFKTSAAVATEVAAVTVPILMQNVQAAKGGFPESIVRADSFNYHDPNNATNLIPTNWTTLIYGPAGNNVDSISDALVDYILANSTHTQAEWTVIFPDIFKRTEFTVVPNYGNYAIPNREVEAGIYSPIANMTALTALVTSYVGGGVSASYPTAHINAHATAMGVPYKSLAVGAIGSIDNTGNEYELTDVFPDYIAVPTTSTDFSRMSQPTQTFAQLLYDLILASESMGPFTALPVSETGIAITRLTRNNFLYAVASYQNIHYLVVAKYNFPPVTS